MQLSPFVEGAEPTPPLGHPRQLVGCPGGSPTLPLFRIYMYAHELLFCHVPVPNQSCTILFI